MCSSTCLCSSVVMGMVRARPPLVQLGCRVMWSARMAACGWKLHRLLAAQAERGLQQQGCLDVGTFDGGKLGLVEGLRTVAGGGTALVHAIGGVVTVHDAGLVDLLGPPPQPGEPVADAGVGRVGIKPSFDKGFDVFWFEGSRRRQFVAEVCEIVRHCGEAASAVVLGCRMSHPCCGGTAAPGPWLNRHLARFPLR